jgi:midasin (ATPase involved in ribosome maturation)
VVEGASLCAASVLDRLNPLLEPGGRLLLGERGVIGGAVPSVQPHPNFRLFLLMDHTCGEVSRSVLASRQHGASSIFFYYLIVNGKIPSRISSSYYPVEYFNI